MNWFRAISPEVTYDNLYVAEDGDFANDGSSPAEAMDVAKLLSLTLGDKTRLLFKRGDTFEIGEIDFDSDHSAIGKYGAGESPILTGSEDISGLTWTDEGSGIYSAEMDEPEHIYINGEAATLAQSAWIVSTAIVSSTVIRGNSATLNAFSSLVGAKIRPFVFSWLMGPERTITGYDSGTGNITMDGTYWDFGEPAVGISFVIYDQLQFVTDNNEWFFDTADNTLYVKAAANPSTLDIRAGMHDTGVHLTGDRIKISGLEMKHYNYAIHSASADASNVDLDDILVTDCKQVPIRLLGSNGGWKRNLRWERCGGNGPVFQGNNSNFQNLTGEDVGMDGNYPWPDGSYRGAGNGLVISGDHNVLQNYHITNTAYNGLSVTGAGNVVKKFIIDAPLQRLRDGGGIYTSGSTATPTVSTNYDGVCIDGIIKNLPTAAADLTSEAAVGLYADNRTDNYRFENVSVEGGMFGAIGNWNSKESQFVNCKFVGFTERGILFRQDTDPADSPLFANNSDNVVTDNIFGCRAANVLCVEARDRNNTTTFNPFSSGDSDSNHYVSPYSANIAGYRQTEGGSLTSYTLSGWRTKMGDDALSTERTNYLTFSSAANALEEVKIEFNETDAAVEFEVPAGYSDEEGNAFDNPVTIAAYGSLVYFKDDEA